MPTPNGGTAIQFQLFVGSRLKNFKTIRRKPNNTTVCKLNEKQAQRELTLCLQQVLNSSPLIATLIQAKHSYIP